MSQAILYSFRRCPYAMRARLSIAVSGITVELREIVLRDKPQAMLDVSPKGTVPVLITPENKVIDESLDVMTWALQQHDPEHWLPKNDDEKAQCEQLVQQNDGTFKHYLDRYKYADRYPEHDQLYYRQQGENILIQLDKLLADNGCLIADRITLADIAILPFIRQFAFVDKAWFDSAPYPYLQAWLQHFLASALFTDTMTKLPPWQPGDEAVFFPFN